MRKFSGMRLWNCSEGTRNVPDGSTGRWRSGKPNNSGECPIMSASARRSLATDTGVARNGRPNGAGQAASELGRKAGPHAGGGPRAKLSVLVAADNRLRREALARMLAKKGNIEVTGLESTVPLRAESVAQANADVLLLTSRGALNDDLLMIQQVRSAAPGLRILLLGMVKDEGEFLQCVRAGISGYLLHDASSDEVLEGVGAVHAGVAVCPGKLCTAMIRYFENEAASMACVSPRRRFGLHGVGTTQLKMRQCSNGFVEHYAAMVEDFLKLCCRFAALMCGKIGFSAHINGVQIGPVVIAKRRQTKFVRSSNPKNIKRLLRV